MSLISTSDIRTWMGVEEGDKTVNPKLEAAALAVQAFCDSFTNRILEATTYLEDQRFSYIDGTGGRGLLLPQYPVSHVSSVHVDNDRVFDSSALISTADFYFYPSGKLLTEGNYFNRGRRNVLVHYTAGYAPVVGGTHSEAVSTYPIPLDLKQVMTEMTVSVIREGMSSLHGIQSDGKNKGALLPEKSFWRTTLNKYKAYSNLQGGYDQ